LNKVSAWLALTQRAIISLYNTKNSSGEQGLCQGAFLLSGCKQELSAMSRDDKGIIAESKRLVQNDVKIPLPVA
jgi:hypothetical protein